MTSKVISKIGDWELWSDGKVTGIDKETDYHSIGVSFLWVLLYQANPEDYSNFTRRFLSDKKCG